jgi:hypothetical protein
MYRELRKRGTGGNALCYIPGMLRALTLHPTSLCPSVRRIDVHVARPRAGSLVLSYVVSGTIGDLRLPAVVEPWRTNELWRHTCFEAFVGAAAAGGYYEFNFAPSTQWAAYQFDDYRIGMRDAAKIPAPAMEVTSGADRFTLRAVLELGGSDLPVNAAWRLSLSAVVEDMSGRQSYWALAHPPGQPDFHHSDCFAVELPPA